MSINFITDVVSLCYVNADLFFFNFVFPFQDLNLTNILLAQKYTL